MSTATANASVSQITSLARAAGMSFTAAEPGSDFTGLPTVRGVLALVAEPDKTQSVELSESFDATEPRFAGQLESFLAETAQRLRNPRPDAYLTILGLPLSFGGFAWPFHGSTSGADTFIVHGQIYLQTGEESPLHAKVSASMTRTFAEVVPALEQPFAESFIYNAVRKTLDQGQLELVKSGNRQPVPVTTRYYSAKQGRFIFNDTDDKQRGDFLAAKGFWLSGILGNNQPIWLTDPRDAQYLNTSTEELKAIAARLAADDLLTLDASGEWGSATDKLRARHDQYEVLVHEALAFIKPTFNEEMRAGNTNM